VKLTGLDLRIIPGVEMVFLHVPLHARPRRSLTLAEERALEALGQRLHVAREAEYQRASVDSSTSRAEVIRRRLAVQLEWRFLGQERQLLCEGLEACIAELRFDPQADVNIHFNGDEYGVTVGSMEDLKERLDRVLTDKKIKRVR